MNSDIIVGYVLHGVGKLTEGTFFLVFLDCLIRLKSCLFVGGEKYGIAINPDTHILHKKISLLKYDCLLSVESGHPLKGLAANDSSERRTPLQHALF